MVLRGGIGILLVAAAVHAGGVLARDAVSSVAAAPGAPEKRYALVVGNGGYVHGALKNPVNDARAMAQELAQSGFDVELLEDATQSGMQRAIRRFGDKLAQGGVGLFYYAGHGMQVKGRNFLVPVNADIDREYEVEYNSVDVNMVLSMMDAAKNPLNIVILDACRTNPFARSFRISANGLAQMDAPSGTFIAFATAPGAIASDGAGANGVYTKHLLAQIRTPGVPIEQLFKQVRIGVIAETKGEQTPWESSSLRGEFAFRQGGQDTKVALAVAEALRRDRETQQKETEKLIQVALERQRRELTALGLSAPLAPAGPIAPPTRLARVGDTWTYRLTEPRRGSASSQRSYVATVTAASSSAILERYSLDQGPAGNWAHSPGAYVVGLGTSVFSPYLQVFQDLHPGPLGSVRIDDPACKNPYACSATATVLGRETVKVAGGTYEAIKVTVEQAWQPASGSSLHQTQQGILRGGRKLTIWYAPAIKRAIKYSSRASYGDYPPIDTDFDLELVSYQLK